ncbi:MAG: hypothetical protein ACLTZI_01820 [[Eubacterium] siraeum]
MRIRLKSGITTSEIITGYIHRVIQTMKTILPFIAKTLPKKRSVKEKRL